jgi:hypothetical protein
MAATCPCGTSLPTVWWQTDKTPVVCQDCFGFAYSRNSFRELPRIVDLIAARNQREGVAA